MRKRNYPLDAWYVAAMSKELADGEVLSRIVCETPLAIYRNQSGKVAALFDRCPHRQYPLSQGVVTGQGLQCGYHGMIFNDDGQCELIPSQELIPKTACVRSYPVKESNGLIWIWPGDIAVAEKTPLPGFDRGTSYRQGLDFSCISDTDNWGVAGPEHIHIKANYLFAVDNLLDLTHTAFVHASTFDNSAVLSSKRDVSLEGEHIHDFFAIEGHLSAALRGLYLLDDVLYENFLETYWASPGVMILVHGATEKGCEREQGAIVLNTNIITPETATTSHYFWVQSVWQNKGDGAVRDNWDMATRAAFAEDEAVLANQQANIDLLERLSIETKESDVVLSADKGITLAHRLIAKKIKEDSLAAI